MGYTHYWKMEKDLSGQEWSHIVRSARKVLELYAPEIDLEYEFDDSFFMFNGLGKDSHEPFIFSRCGDYFNFCKTARKPYDAVVVKMLITIKKIVPKKITLSSDGNIF